MKNQFIEKYTSKIQGLVSCYDRVLIKGTLHSVGHSEAMVNLMYRKNILLKDYPNFINPYRNKLHTTANQQAKASNIEIEFIRKTKAVRKEDIVQRHILQRNLPADYTGLVCILSVMEGCKNYRYSYDKTTRRSTLKMTNGKCLHYYYYFIDADLGLCHFRVPTWCPFRLQFYFNGHNWLARQLDKAQISYELIDNAIVNIGTINDSAQTIENLYAQVQKISDSFDISMLQNKLDTYADRFCPVAKELCQVGYHWSILQAEYATDIIFKDDKTVGKIYDNTLNTLIQTVQPVDIAKFLGRKALKNGQLHGKNNLEIDTSCKSIAMMINGQRHLMRRIKHRMGSSSIKMYDKYNRVLRIETTTNNPSEFYHYRSVEQRDGVKTNKLAPVKKYIYSLKPLAQIMYHCNKRYVEFIAAFDHPNIGKKRLQKVTKDSKVNNRNYKGFNFFNKDDERIFKAIADGSFIMNGFRNKNLKTLTNKSTPQISRIIKRLRVKGLIRKVKKSYRYILTKLGQQIIATSLNFKELILIKQLEY